MVNKRLEPEFPVKTSDSRIVGFLCLGHNELATFEVPSEPSYGARFHTSSTNSAPIAGVRLVHFISSPATVQYRFWSAPTQLGNVLASGWRVRTLSASLIE